MEVGQSGRHLRAVRSARREMWDSIASSAGIPVGARVSAGGEHSSDPFVVATSQAAEEDDAVVIHVRTFLPKNPSH
jgi:hypothetical protein